MDPGEIPARFIRQLGRSRQVIDALVFQTIATDCHLGQPSVHHRRTLVVLTTVRVLACTLVPVFYLRQVRGHSRANPPSFCEMASQVG